MEHLWTCTPARPDGETGRELYDAIGIQRGIGYTTLMTVLDRMVGKELLSRLPDGRVWRYSASATRESLTSQALHHTLGELAGTDLRTALLHFLEESTPEQVQDLRAALSDLETRHGEHRTHPADYESD